MKVRDNTYRLGCRLYIRVIYSFGTLTNGRSKPPKALGKSCHGILLEIFKPRHWPFWTSGIGYRKSATEATVFPTLRRG
jgi:hypothetical protein